MLSKNHLSCLVWPCLVSLPLTLTYNDLYKSMFPAEWYDEEARDFWYTSNSTWPSPLGLSLGIMAVVVGQFFMLLYFVLIAHKGGKQTATHMAKEKRKGGDTTNMYFPAIQKEGARPYELAEGLFTHLAQPEGFVMLGGYLIGTWMFGLMPASYYSFKGGINWGHVAAQLLLQDLIQYLMHLVEHEVKTTSTVKFPSILVGEKGLTISWPFNLYTVSHKPHHRFTNPRIFDAFNGSPADTGLMILVPLLCTARLVDANVWSYMAFGSLYANWLTLIHAEYSHPWERLFRAIGFGTAADHHVHHKLFNYNYGHTFMYWDRLFGTYKDPNDVSVFNKNI